MAKLENWDSKSYQEKRETFTRKQMLAFAETCMVDVLSEHDENTEYSEISSENLDKIKKVLKRYDFSPIMSVKFTIDDIKDRGKLEKMVKYEAEQIYKSDVACHGRSLEDIEFSVRQSKVAELYMIENFGYEESDIKWHDLKKDGEYTEVKAYSGAWSSDAPFVQKDLRKYRNAEWSKSKWYLLFRFTNGEYELLDKIQI